MRHLRGKPRQHRHRQPRQARRLAVRHPRGRYGDNHQPRGLCPAPQPGAGKPADDAAEWQGFDREDMLDYTSPPLAAPVEIVDVEDDPVHVVVVRDGLVLGVPDPVVLAADVTRQAFEILADDGGHPEPLLVVAGTDPFVEEPTNADAGRRLDLLLQLAQGTMAKGAIGGGVAVFFTTPDGLTFDGCAFDGNTAVIAGGGMSGVCAALAAALAVQRPNSRSAETEADRIGIELAAKAGYDPKAAVTLWQKMGSLGGGAPPEFLSTHPAPGNREAALAALSPEMRKLNPSGQKAPVHPVQIIRG